MSEVGFRVYEPNGVVAVGTNTQGVWPIAVLTITDEYFARVKFGNTQYTYAVYGTIYAYDPPRVFTSFEDKLLRRTCTLNGTDDTFAQGVIETTVTIPTNYYNLPAETLLIGFSGQTVPEVKVALPTPVKFSDIYIIPIPTEVDVASLPEVTADVLSTELSIKNSPQATAVPTYPADPRPPASGVFYAPSYTSPAPDGCTPQVVSYNALGYPLYFGDPCYDKWLASYNLAKANTVVWEKVGASHSAKFYVLGKGK